MGETRCRFFFWGGGAGEGGVGPRHPPDMIMKVGIQYKIVLKGNYKWGSEMLAVKGFQRSCLRASTSRCH